MTANQTRPVPRKRLVNKETIVGFSADTLRAPFSLRLASASIDYLIVIVFPVGFLLLARIFGSDGSALINSELNNIGWLLGILIAACNLIALPAISGRTLGKFLTGLSVVDSSGAVPKIKAMLLRQTLGYFIVLATGGLSFLLAAFSSRGRALHDLISGTVVIHGEKVRRS
ncbi:MAG: RDD family protein [Pyrinomonadaceae bacterium]|nr:RDD family protein [Pyrinomonadaceae bacterium]